MAHNNKGNSKTGQRADANKGNVKITLKTPTDVEEKSLDVVINGYISGAKRPKKVLGLKDIGFNPIYQGSYTVAVVDKNGVKFDDNTPVAVDAVYFYVDKRQHIKYSNGQITISSISTRPVIVADNGKRRIAVFIQRNDMANIVTNVIGDIVADN